jgi:hypothetical protein
MENLKNDWSGEVEETQATTTQISIIEQLLITATISEKEKEQIEAYLEQFSEEEAYNTINYLKSNNKPLDPAKQWEQHLKKKL